MRFIYMIGAQCTGKTTLSNALAKHIKSHLPQFQCHLLSETARTVLKIHGYTREDVREGGDRCLRLQQLILESQLQVENMAAKGGFDVVISDRSGVDPLVYAGMYCGSDCMKHLLRSDMWTQLKTNMCGGLLVLCEPVEEWLFDDGTRIMPSDWTEWTRIHGLFDELLTQNKIEHVVLPASIRQLQDRIDFVLSLCKPLLSVDIQFNDEYISIERLTVVAGSNAPMPQHQSVREHGNIWMRVPAAFPL